MTLTPLLLAKKEVSLQIRLCENIQRETIAANPNNPELRYWEGYIFGLKVALREL